MYEKYDALLDKTNKTSYRVSKDTGIGQNLLSAWKTGKVKSLGIENLVKLADYFGTSVDYFVRDKEDKKNE